MVAFDAYAWLLTVPATEVGTAPIADALGAFDELPRLVRLKYATVVNRWTNLVVPVARLHTVTAGHLEHSLLWRELLRAHGVRDVMSIVFRDQYGCWSFLDLWCLGSIFSEREEEALTQHAGVITSRKSSQRSAPAAGATSSRGRRPLTANPSAYVGSGSLSVLLIAQVSPSALQSGRIRAVSSISTAMSKGSSASPTALRVCRPRSPNTSISRSEQPLMTAGV